MKGKSNKEGENEGKRNKEEKNERETQQRKGK